MAEPVRKPIDEPELPDEGPGITVQRWVERPGGGRMEQVEMPLTPELFLNPRVGDHMNPGKRHGDTARQIADLLEEFFRPAPDVLVTFGLKYMFGRGLDQPSPDVSVIRGVRDKDADRESFHVLVEGVRPCLIVEVVSPLSSRIRKVDLEDKVVLYRKAAIPEYLIVDSQVRDRRLRLIGYRLFDNGHSVIYQSIRPDEEGRVLSETTGLWFQVSPDGNRVQLFEHPSGQPLLSREEMKSQLRAAKEKARAAEDENDRLRAEINRLRNDQLWNVDAGNG